MFEWSWFEGTIDAFVSDDNVTRFRSEPKTTQRPAFCEDNNLTNEALDPPHISQLHIHCVVKERKDLKLPLRKAAAPPCEKGFRRRKGETG